MSPKHPVITYPDVRDYVENSRYLEAEDSRRVLILAHSIWKHSHDEAALALGSRVEDSEMFTPRLQRMYTGYLGALERFKDITGNLVRDLVFCGKFDTAIAWCANEATLFEDSTGPAILEGWVTYVQRVKEAHATISNYRGPPNR